MIATIGSLVKETSTRLQWFIAVLLYIAACTGSAMLMGVGLSLIGVLLRSAVDAFGPSMLAALAYRFEFASLGLVAVAYGLSDVGILPMPRPHIMHAVPVTWWRNWRPYGAALAYGAALGLGITTRIPFGAYYVLCAWCTLHGNPIYGAALMGTYGLARALALIPSSWQVFCRRVDAHESLLGYFSMLGNAQVILAAGLFGLGVVTLVVMLP